MGCRVGLQALSQACTPGTLLAFPVTFIKCIHEVCGQQMGTFTPEQELPAALRVLCGAPSALQGPPTHHSPSQNQQRH